VWSVGVCAFVMVRGRFPFDVKVPTARYASHMQAMSAPVASREVPPPSLISPKQHATFSPRLLELLNAALALDPRERPSANQLASFEWLVIEEEEGEREEAEPAIDHVAYPVGDAVAANATATMADPQHYESESCPSQHSDQATQGRSSRHEFSTPQNSPEIKPRQLNSDSTLCKRAWDGPQPIIMPAAHGFSRKKRKQSLGSTV
jgi:serine/threonine protein kinase